MKYIFFSLLLRCNNIFAESDFDITFASLSMDLQSSLDMYYLRYLHLLLATNCLDVPFTDTPSSVAAICAYIIANLYLSEKLKVTFARVTSVPNSCTKKSHFHPLESKCKNTAFYCESNHSSNQTVNEKQYKNLSKP